MRCLTVKIVVCGSVVAAAFSAASAQPHYQSTDLGVFGGNGYLRCIAINQSGQVALSYQGTPQRRAAVWTPTTPNGRTGTRVDIGTFPDAYEIDAQAINDAGAIVGVAYFNHSGPRAFVWTPNVPHGSTGTLTNLGTLGGGDRSEAYGINNVGQITGYAYDSANNEYTFISTGVGIAIAPHVPARSYAWAINDAGQIAGGASSGPTCGYADAACVSDSSSFTSLFYGCSVTAQCYGINSTGTVCGKGGNAYAFMWTPNTPNGSTGTLTTFPPTGGASETEAYAINNAGVMCGRFYHGGPHAAVWVGGSIFELNTITTPATDLLWEARSINDAGQIVCAAGNGHAYLLSPKCVADVDDGSGTGTPDGGVTIDDLLYYLALFASGNLAADVDDGSGNGLRDGGVTIDDLLYFLARFAAGC